MTDDQGKEIVNSLIQINMTLQDIKKAIEGQSK